MSLDALLTIPNLISLMRAVMGPIALVLLLENTDSILAIALTFMLIAELSDFFDGYIARRFDQDTEIGRLLDPVCDSIYRLSVFLAFLANGWLPAWMFFIIYARDLIVPYLRTFSRQVGHTLEVRWSGKAKAATQGLSQIVTVIIVLGFYSPDIMSKEATIDLVLGFATLVSVISLIDYTWAVIGIRKSVSKTSP